MLVTIEVISNNYQVLEKYLKLNVVDILTAFPGRKNGI